jgi:endonuclease YncB( thermonuclease family)
MHLQLLSLGDPLVRPAEVVRVKDGDTFVARVRLWPAPPVYVEASVRVLGVNAPDAGEGGHDEAAHELSDVLLEGPVTLQAVKVDKYGGRVDAIVIVHGPGGTPPIVVADELIALGVAVPWDGQGPRPLVPWPPTHGPYAQPMVVDPGQGKA